MAHFKKLPAAIQSVIQEKLGQLTSPLIESLGGSPMVITLHETVDIWLLPANMITQPTNSIRELAKPTGQYHHQLKASSIPIAYGRTHALGADSADWSVDSICNSADIAQQFELAIDEIDNMELSDDLQARLLSVPAYHLQAFWLIDSTAPEDDSRQLIVVIEAPSEYGFELRTKHYTPKEFLNKLRQVSHVQGIF